MDFKEDVFFVEFSKKKNLKKIRKNTDRNGFLYMIILQYDVTNTYIHS